MNKANKKLFTRRRQEIVYRIKCHSEFLTQKLESLNKVLESNETGSHYALLTEELIGASSCIPLIVKELGNLREEYAALNHE
jgi:hypothetical protein